MNYPISLSIAGITVYWLSAIFLALFYRKQQSGILILCRLLWMLGLVFHAIVLSISVFTPEGINLSFVNALSTAGWIIAMLLFVTSLTQPLRGLGMLILPIAALSLTAGLIIPDLTTRSTSSSIALDSHIFLSLLAYSVLALAAAQALLLAYQHNQLRKHKPVGMVSYLAPMQHTEALMFILISLGFILLSLSLASGLFFLENFLDRGQIHKTVLSMLAWCVFAVLLWGRWKLGWRGVKAIRLTLWGFGLLVLAYFGSKLIRELILNRA